MDNNFQGTTEGQTQQETYQQSQSTYQQSAVYQQPNSFDDKSSDLEEPVSMGHWLVCMLITLIPCAGFIMLFVWAFSSTEKKSKSNFYKATLIWILISSVLSFFFIMIFGIAIASMVANIPYYY